MKLFFAVFAALSFTSAVPAYAQGKLVVDQALEVLEKACQVSKKLTIDGGLGIDFTLKDKGGALLGKVNIGYGEISELIERLPAEQRLQGQAALSQCILGSLDKMIAHLRGPDQGPIVVVMDSFLVPYREAMTSQGETNADDITIALRGVAVTEGAVRQPVRPVKESTGLQWDDELRVLSLPPKLVIIHFSAFESATIKCRPSPQSAKQNQCNETFFPFARSVIKLGIPMIIYSRIENLCSYKDAFVAHFKDAVNQGKGLNVVLLQMGVKGRENFRMPGPREDIGVLSRNLLQLKEAIPAASPPLKWCALLR